MTDIAVCNNTRPIALVFSNDARYLASSAHNDVTLRVWNVATGRPYKVLIGHGKPTFCLAFAPNNIHLASGSQDGTVKVWDFNNNKCVKTLRTAWKDVKSVKYSGDGEFLLVLSRGDFKVWHVSCNYARVYYLSDFRNINNCYFVRQYLFLAMENQVTVLKFARNADTAALVHCKTIETSRHRIVKNRNAVVTISPDGKWLSHVYDDPAFACYTVCASQLPALSVKRYYVGLCTFVRYMTYSTDMKYLVASSAAGEICIWNFATCALMRHVSGLGKYMAKAVSHDASLIACTYVEAASYYVADKNQVIKFQRAVDVSEIEQLCNVLGDLLPPYILLDVINMIFAYEHENGFQVESEFFAMQKLKTIEQTRRTRLVLK
jgi:WD40 repeat protein